MAGSGARERVFQSTDPYAVVPNDQGDGATAGSRWLRRLTPNLLFRAGVGLVVAFLLMQPGIYLTYRDRARWVDGSAAAAQVGTADSDVQHLLLAAATMQHGLDGYVAGRDPAFLLDYEGGQREAAAARSALHEHVRGTGLEGAMPGLDAAMDGWLAWAAARRTSLADGAPAIDAGAEQGQVLYGRFRDAARGFDQAAGARARSIAAATSRAESASLRDSVITAELGGILLLAIGLRFVAVALRPVSRLSTVAHGLAAGGGQPVPYRERRDEVGELARGLASWQEAEASQRVRAAETVRQLLPTRAPTIEGYELAGACLTAEEVGGDFFDWYEDDAGSVTITLGDVMGKGLAGAILMVAVRAGLRAGSRLPTVASTVHSLARSIAANVEQAGAFVTLFHGRLSPESGNVAYVDAGHSLVLVLRDDGGAQRPPATGMPLGVLPGQAYSESSIRLRPGETLVVFSDGVLDLYPEMRRPEQAAQLLRDAGSAQEVVDRVTAGAGDRRLADDVAVVVLRRVPAAEARSRADELQVAIECGAGAEQLGAVHEAMAAFWPRVVPFPADEWRMLFELAVSEIAANIVEHARPDRMALRLRVAGAAVVAELTDTGRGWKGARPPSQLGNDMAERGRGLALARTAMDEVEYRREGDVNRWRLVKRL